MNTELVTTMIQALHNFSEDEVLALHRAISLWSDIGEENMAYKKAIQYQLCDTNGVFLQPIELMTAVDHVLDNMEHKNIEPHIKMKDEFIFNSNLQDNAVKKQYVHNTGTDNIMEEK